MADDSTVKEVDAELVNEQAIERRASVPATIYQLAELEMQKGGGVSVAEAVDKIILSLRRAAIAQTMPDDWTLYKNRDGRITGYLEDQGCKRITKLWRIEIYNFGPNERSPHWSQITDDTGEYAVQITADARCGWTGEELLSLTGTRYSTDDFAQQKPSGIQRLMAVAAGARANLDGNATRKLAGVEGVSVEELDECWKGSWKTSQMCNKGRGFGSANERAGGASKHGIDQADIPECDVCRIPLVWREGREGKEGFFGCRNWERHKETKVIVLLSKAKELAANKRTRQPGDEQ
jgi:hypothetical protein